MRIVIDLPDTADLEAAAYELAVSKLPWRNRLGFALQRAIQAAVIASLKSSQDLTGDSTRS